MIFKTIHITRTRLIAAALSLVTLVSALVVTIYTKNRTVSVFSQKELYDDILQEGLPNNNDKNLSPKSVLDKLLGFDISNGQSIIEEFSPIFEDESENITPPQDDTLPPTPTATPEEESPDVVLSPQIPTREQITSFGGVELSNSTAYNINTTEFVASEPVFNLNCDTSPEVLIMHTHTTESFGDFGERNTDAQKNVVSVGMEMKKVFEQNGIGVVHDTTVHDYPSYQGAYTRALKTIENNIKNNPSIKIVLDIHRDGYVYADGSRLTKTTKINGESVAQVMLVCGSDSLGLYHPQWRENLKLASKIQSTAAQMYPTLMRPIDLRKERFNMHTSNGSLLLEIGANGNTLEEAKRGAIYAASAICAAINQCY